MAYTKIQWKDNAAPYRNAANLNKQEQGIYEASKKADKNEVNITKNRTDIDKNTANILGLGTGEIYQGTWTPAAGNEYPSGAGAGYSYYITGLNDSGYTFTVGDLNGRLANNNDKIIFNGTTWSMIDNTNCKGSLYFVDTIADMTALTPLNGAVVNVRGYHTPNDGGGGVFNYDASQSGVNNGGTIINGWVRQYSGATHFEWFGNSNGDDISDRVEAVLNENSYIVFKEGGNFTISREIVVTNNNLKIEFSNTIIEGTGADHYSISFTPNTHKIADLSPSDIDFDAGTVTVDTTGVKLDDSIVIFSSDLWNPSRTYYYEGEVLGLKKVEANLLYVQDFFSDGYVNNIELYKIDASLHLSGLNINRGATNKGSVRAIGFSKLVVEDCSFYGAEESNLLIASSTNCMVSRVKCNSDYPSSGGTNYGVVLAYCQDTIVKDSVIVSGRHTITTGGSDGFLIRMVNRNITYDNVNGTGINSSAFDFHGNTEFSKMINCTGNGFAVAGTNLIVDNCSHSLGKLPRPYFAAGIVRSGFLKVTNNSFIQKTIGHPIFTVESFVPKSNPNGVTLLISGNSLEAKNSSSKKGIEISGVFKHISIKDNSISAESLVSPGIGSNCITFKDSINMLDKGLIEVSSNSLINFDSFIFYSDGGDEATEHRLKVSNNFSNCIAGVNVRKKVWIDVLYNTFDFPDSVSTAYKVIAWTPKYIQSTGNTYTKGDGVAPFVRVITDTDLVKLHSRDNFGYGVNPLGGATATFSQGDMKDGVLLPQTP